MIDPEPYVGWSGKRYAPGYDAQHAWVYDEPVDFAPREGYSTNIQDYSWEGLR